MVAEAALRSRGDVVVAVVDDDDVADDDVAVAERSSASPAVEANAVYC